MLESTPLLSGKSTEWNHFITESKYTCASVKPFLDVGQSSLPAEGWILWEPILSLFACVETDSAKLSSVMGELGFEFKPKLKR